MYIIIRMTSKTVAFRYSTSYFRLLYEQNLFFFMHSWFAKISISLCVCVCVYRRHINGISSYKHKLLHLDICRYVCSPNKFWATRTERIENCSNVFNCVRLVASTVPYNILAVWLCGRVLLVFCLWDLLVQFLGDKKNVFLFYNECFYSHTVFI